MRNGIFLILLFLIPFGVANAQSDLREGVYEKEVVLDYTTANAGVNLPLPQYPYAVKKATFSVSFKTIEHLGNIAHKASCTPIQQALGLIANKPPLLLDENKDSRYLVMDITNTISTLSNPFHVSAIITGSSTNSQVQAKLLNILRAEFKIRVEYDIRVAGIANITYQAASLQGKAAKFMWGANAYAPNYQFQILKLKHSAEYPIPAGNKVITTVNWDEALTIETQKDTKEFLLTISEGTGFYAWRVRPIGNIVGEKGETGVANPSNWGEWSCGGSSIPFTFTATDATQTNTNVTVTPSSTVDWGNKVFFFKDVDEDRNYIHSRTFTEKSGVGEKIVYGNTIGQTKQSQTYLPSQKQMVTTHMVYDHVGRPTLGVLPVPQDAKGIEGYKEKFLVPTDGTGTEERPYRDKDFDLDNNKRNPQTITNSNFDYYKGIDSPGSKNVASAEGYVFSRIIYKNDGTNRVEEQSGVGKKHMVGNTPDRGRTTKMVYETAPEMELLRLFGKEAPNAESVQKVTSIDPNGTESISYTSKEGKVLATCYVPKSNTSIDLDDLQDMMRGIMIDDFITQNTSEKIGADIYIVSNKTYTFLSKKALDVSYTKNCLTSNSFLQYCDYNLEITISRTDGQPLGTSLQDILHAGANPAHRPWKFTDPNTRTQIKSETIPISCGQSSSAITTIFQKLNLSGSFVVEKRLKLLNFEDRLKQLQQEMKNKTMPLVGMVSDWLSGVDCPQKAEEFYNKIATLEYLLKGKTTLNDIKNSQNVVCASSKNCNYPTPPTQTVTNPIAPTVEQMQAITNFYGEELKLTKVNNAYPAFFTSLHTVTLTKYVDIKIQTPTCSDLRIPLSISMSVDLTQIKTEDVNGKAGIQVNPMMFLDGILKSVTPSYTPKTEFYPDMEGYSYGYFWPLVPTDNDMIWERLLSVEPIKKPSNKDKDGIDGDEFVSYTTKDLLLMELFDGQEKTNAEIKASALSNFVTKYSNQLYLPEASFLDTPFLMGAKVKDYLGVATIEDLRLRVMYIHYAFLYPNMKGWHTPGTFDLMVNKMLTDSYTMDGFTSDDENPSRKLVYNGPLPKTDGCGTPQKLYGGTIPSLPAETSEDKVYVPQYYVSDIVQCWETQLAKIKSNALSGGAIEDDSPKTLDEYTFDAIGNSLNVGNEFDKQNGGMDQHVNDNLNLGWLAKALFGGKIKKKIKSMSKMLRMMQVHPNARASYFEEELTAEELAELRDMPYIAPEYQYHMVAEFLECTGYKFAKILTHDDYAPLSSDVQTNFAYPQPTKSLSNLVGDTYDGIAYDGFPQNRKYKPSNKWRKSLSWNKNPQALQNWDQDAWAWDKNNPSEIFEYIKDPIYAFKYFEYPEGAVGVEKVNENGYRLLEINTCYKDYSVGETSPCYVCGVGKIKCEQTRVSWAGDQRYGFYNMLRGYYEDRGYAMPPGEKVEDYSSIGFKDYDKADANISANFRLWQDEMKANDTFITEAEYNNLLSSTIRPKTFIEIQLDLLNAKLKDACEAQKSTLKTEVIRLLQARCYEIVDCAVGPTLPENQVLRADIDNIVDGLIKACIDKGKLSSFRAYNVNSCKYARYFNNKPANHPVPLMPIVEYGLNVGAQPGLLQDARLLRFKSFNFNFLSNILSKEMYLCNSKKLLLTDGTPIKGNLVIGATLPPSDNIAYYPLVDLANMSNSDVMQAPSMDALNDRMQALTFKMKMDMPCRCNPTSNCDNTEFKVIDCATSPSAGGQSSSYSEQGQSSLLRKFRRKRPDVTESSSPNKVIVTPNNQQ
jgi:hypothetical protein